MLIHVGTARTVEVRAVAWRVALRALAFHAWDVAAEVVPNRDCLAAAAIGSRTDVRDRHQGPVRCKVHPPREETQTRSKTELSSAGLKASLPLLKQGAPTKNAN